MTDLSYPALVTTQAIQVLIIHPDESYELRVIEQDLKTLQGIVGGWIEAIPTEHCVFFADEDGKDKGCPTNTLATYLWWHYRPEMERIDVLSGPIFVTGGDDGQGDSLPVPPEVVETFERIKAIYEEHKDIN